MMADERKLPYKREDIVAALKKYKAEADSVYAEALVTYKVKATEKLNRALGYIAEDQVVSAVNLSPPIETAKAYDNAIQMFERTTEESILLTEREFRQYMMDEWSWSNGWMASNARYSVTARAKMAGAVQDFED